MSGQNIPPGITAKYDIRGTLGAGAMGVVYDAWDRVIERRVAIKVVRRPGGDDPEAIEAHARFRREAQAAGRLQHPNIVAVYDYGEDETAAWIVMELVEGGSLKKPLDAKDRFPIPEIVRVMTQVLDALDYSHKRGVVHRDIKPANVMLGEGGQVKLADFGIARIENSSMTQVGQVMGTPSYMAPEQLRGEPVDLRADIWAAGVLLYQLLTGAKPFEGDFVALSHRVLHTEPPPPSALSVTCPRAFDAVVAKALAKRPEDRYPSAAAFAEAIRAAAAAPAAAPLPMADADATMVAGRTAAAPSPAAAAAPPAAPARRGGPPWALIGGGLAAAAAAAATVLLLLPGPAPEPTPPSPAATAPAQPGPPAQPQPPPQQTATLTPPPAAPGTAAPPATTAALAQPQQQPALLSPAAPQPPAAQMTPTPPATTTSPPPAATTTPPPQPEAQAAVTPPPQATPSPAQPAVTPPAAQPGGAPALPSGPTVTPPLLVTPPQPQAQTPAAPAQPAPQPGPATTPPAQPGATPTPPAAQTTAPPPLLVAPPTPQQQATVTPAPQPSATPTPPPGPATTPPTPPEQATVPPPPQPGAATPQQQQTALLVPLRPDYRAAAAAAVGAAPCGLIAAAANDEGLQLLGVAQRDQVAAVRAALAARAIAPGDPAARVQIQPFDGPYCPVVVALRGVLAGPAEAPRVAVDGAMPLRRGQFLRFEVTMPDWPAHLYVAYFMKSGEVAHLVPSERRPPGARVRLGDPAPGFPGWEVDEPFGTDLMLVVASEHPLFPGNRPFVEAQDVYLAALSAALEGARRQGARVLVRPVVVETAER